MKKIKIGLPILAFVLAVTASAFTTKNALSRSTIDDPLWHFQGTTVGEQSDASRYELLDEQNPPVCEGNALYCIIEAPADASDPSQPDLSAFNPQTDVISKKP